MEDADEPVRQLPQRGTPGVDGLTVAAVGERLVSRGFLDESRSLGWVLGQVSAGPGVPNHSTWVPLNWKDDTPADGRSLVVTTRKRGRTSCNANTGSTAVRGIN